MKQVCSNVIMGSDRPTSLHGGAVLGVGFDKKIRPGAAPSAQPLHSLDVCISKAFLHEQLRSAGRDMLA